MKKTLFHLFLAISFAQTLSAQVVNIPDANFKDALLQDMYINTNGDNEIQVSEAEAYTSSLYVQYKKIKDLKGIEAFVNLKKLDCSFNLLITLDVSKNIQLTYLKCWHNQLTTLDISKNVVLNHLICAENQLITLDVSKNTALNIIDCYSNKLTALDISKNIALNYLKSFDNQFKSLDVSKNINLVNIDCSNNQLTTLDISKNIQMLNLYCNDNQLTTLNVKNGANNKLYDLYAENNPQLKCIQVDDPNKIGINWIKDNQATYSTNCNVSTNDNTATIPQFNLYPNPASQTLHIDWEGDATPVAITLYNSIGAAVKTQQLPQQGSINIADLPRGMYLCRINNANHQSQTTKVVIE